MKLTEKQQSFKEKIFTEMEERRLFCTRNERREKKYAWLITAINNAKIQEWTKENFDELVFFYNHMHDFSYEDLLRLWKANKFTTIFS